MIPLIRMRAKVAKAGKTPKLDFRVSVLESIVKDLETLPATKLVEVAHYISRLNPRRREERLAALQATAGCLSGAEGDAFEKAVRAMSISDTWKV